MRTVFFSFHYQDVFRVNVVRNSHIVEGCAAAGFVDGSLWERTKAQGDAAIKRLIDSGLTGTTVTVVLIGSHTAYRKYVAYEIEQSIKRNNGLVGIHINNIKGANGIAEPLGPIPQPLINASAPIYTWDQSRFGDWVETAYKKAHPFG